MNNIKHLRNCIFVLLGIVAGNFPITLKAQSPEKISYQALVRDANNTLISNKTIGMQISILQNSVLGTAVYMEKHNPLSNENGLVTLEIGSGSLLAGSFADIDWSEGPYFLKTEMDPLGGSNYTVSGVVQLLSVPYALHAKTASAISGGVQENDPIFSASIAHSIQSSDTFYWNQKLDSFSEVDPYFKKSIAFVIGSQDTAHWNHKLDSFTELDPIFNASVAAGISQKDTSNWNKDTDPENEIQKLSVSDKGDTLYLDKAGFVIIPGISAANAPPSTYPAGSVNCSATATVINDITNPSTGKVWMDRNLGASKSAGSTATGNSVGDLYQWGRRSDGHQCRNSSTLSNLSNIDTPSHGRFILAPNTPNDWRSPQNANLWNGVSGINNPCPTKYRLPTSSEWAAEYASWSSANATGAMGSALQLPITGYRNPANGGLNSSSVSGHYWSSTTSGTSTLSLYFNSTNVQISTDLRSNGMAVRCIKD